MSGSLSDWSIPRVTATNNPRAHEEACLRAAEQAINTPGHLKIQRLSGRQLKDIRLEGSFPDTILRVTLVYGSQRGGQRELAFEVWKRLESHGVPIGDEHVPRPSVFGINVVGWALES